MEKSRVRIEVWVVFVIFAQFHDLSQHALVTYIADFEYLAKNIQVI